MKMKCFPCVFVLLVLLESKGESRESKPYPNSHFVKIFSQCHRSDRQFDACMLKALNKVQPYFKHGVPELNIPPFDPFFAEQIIQSRGGSTINYRLKLRNVYERGWTLSKVTKFKSDLNNGFIRYHQWFPEKYLQGEWYMDSNLVTPYSNSGTFDLSLFNYTQVTTVRRKDRVDSDSQNPYHVRIDALTCGDLKLHITNLLRGRSAMEFLLDRMINLTWRPGFLVLRPLIDDLVSTAFTKIMNDAFRDFPFEEVIPK